MWSNINIVFCYFGNLSPALKLRLFKRHVLLYIYSLYDSVLWDLDHSSIDALYAWRTGLRRV